MRVKIMHLRDCRTRKVPAEMLAHFSRPRAFGRKRTSAPATSIHSLHCTTFGKTRARCTKYRTQYAPARVIARCNRSATNANCACNSSTQGGDSHAARSQGERFLYRAKGCPKRQQSRFRRTGRENGPFVALYAHLQLCSCGHVYRGLRGSRSGLPLQIGDVRRSAMSYTDNSRRRSCGGKRRSSRFGV